MFQPLRASVFDAETRAVCIGSGRFVVRYARVFTAYRAHGAMVE